MSVAPCGEVIHPAGRCLFISNQEVIGYRINSACVFAVSAVSANCVTSASLSHVKCASSWQKRNTAVDAPSKSSLHIEELLTADGDDTAWRDPLWQEGGKPCPVNECSAL